MSQPAAAGNLTVPGDHPTVRAAVAAAAHGDVIVVAPGVHDGGAFVNNKAITVASWYLLTGDTTWVAQTILRGVPGNPCGGAPGCAGNGVLEYGNNAHGCRIIGLTLENGENGVAASSAVDISHCRVINNGDGVDYVDGAGGTLDHTLFAFNTDDGVDLNGYMNVTVRDNIIVDNGDDGIEYRLHAYVGPVTEVVIRDNHIEGNGEDGIQLIDYPEVSDIVVRIEGNLLTGNFDGSGSSAGVGVMPNGNTIENLVGAPMVERVYLIGNTFRDERYGMVGGANVIALNNIFTGTQFTAVRRVGGSSITAYTLFWNNTINYETSVVDSAHTLHADPMLRSDGSLTTGSPAIDRGTGSFTWQGETVLIPPTQFIGDAPDLGGFEHVPNAAPSVDLGPDRTVTAGSLTTLAGVVTDDGRLVPEGYLTYAWTVLGGPGPVDLGSPQAPVTTAGFDGEGVYTLSLSAFDGEMTGADTLHVTVQPASGTLERRVAMAADDAEELASGVISSQTGWIELVQDGSPQTVGLRFTGVTVPHGATITAAWLQFSSAGIQNVATNLLVRAQAADNPAPFASTFGNISSRPRTAAGTAWQPPAWTMIGQAGAAQRTPSLSAVLQEVVNRPGWSSGSPMVIIITGSGLRTAESYEGNPPRAALLHVEFTTPVTGVGEGPAPSLALRRVGAHPTSGAVAVEFDLVDHRPASLALVDVTGRARRILDVGALGPGRHRAELGTGLPVGVYWVKLVQGDQSAVIKAVVLR